MMLQDARQPVPASRPKRRHFAAKLPGANPAIPTKSLPFSTKFAIASLPGLHVWPADLHCPKTTKNHKFTEQSR
jgi:hypothetical protein